MTTILIWWKRHWTWTLALAAIVTVFTFVLISRSNNFNNPNEEVAFDRLKWAIKKDQDYPYRNQMLKDLFTDDKLKELSKDEVIAILGEPDRTDNNYFFYRIEQQRIQFIPLHTKTLVIKLDHGKVKSVMIHE